MKILAIADRPPRRKIEKIISEHSDIEMICLLGDLTVFDLSGLQNINHLPKIGVYGNHCSGSYFEDFGVENIHLNTFSYKGFTFGGFEGSVRYKQDPYAKMYTQEEASQLLKDFPYVDVFLAHCPPYGINDNPEEQAHEGFHVLKKYLDEKSPLYFLHSHTYPTKELMITKYHNTKIIYIYSDKIVEL